MLTNKRINENRTDRKKARRIRRKRNSKRRRKATRRNSMNTTKNYARSIMILILKTNASTTQTVATI